MKSNGRKNERKEKGLRKGLTILIKKVLVTKRVRHKFKKALVAKRVKEQLKKALVAKRVKRNE